MRGLAAFLGFLLITVGLIVTFSTWTVDGWTVLAGLGVALLANDLRIELREEDQ